MALFQTSVLKQYIHLQDQASVDKAYKKYQKYFLNPTIQDNIRSSKEEEYQGIFLTELFVNILGYTLKPKADFNLVAEYKNQTNARKADGAILFDDLAIGVIELKGTKTKDLESIRKQAFDYKANQKGCVYVITSNFEKLRFYINDATEYEEFNLFELSPERFALLYLCLQKDNVLTNKPLKIKEASVVEEEQITKQFYKDYSLFKRELYRDLVKRNAKTLKANASLSKSTSSAAERSPEEIAEQQKLEKNVKLTLFKKSQKLIDRYLFIFFAEDRGLLPPNSTQQILDKWKDDVAFGDDRPLYTLFKQYFDFLDQGRAGTSKRAEIYAYNGGLFKTDITLDSLDIDSDLLYKHTSKLAAYDFESQVDVNILGHIFENSLNEIESVNAEIEGADFDKQKSKRKKDGVFYTPKYITKYIVENTVGKLCDEKKSALGFKEEEYFKGRKNRQKATIEKLVGILDTYREWLLQITICDPACGSGAFLNQALDFLIKEHTYIDELKAKILGGGIVFSDIENTILENNIYGVDLNEESVEIAKLSLWLRTAQPRRKLNDLSSNIKCGNSLIDSKAVAGDKAFHWETAFAKVFEKGGFDVIIGNPPYVQLQKMKVLSSQIKKIGYQTYESTGDLYCLFYEKGNQILKNRGLLGFITSNKWMRANYGKSLRKYFYENTNPYKLLDLGSGIFDSAVVDSNIILFEKSKTKNFQISSIDISDEKDVRDLLSFNNSFVNISPKSEEVWTISSKLEQDIKQKVLEKGIPLKEWDVNINRGILTGLTDAFVIDAAKRKEFLINSPNCATIIQPILRGRDVDRYEINFQDLFLLNIHNGYDDVNKIDINNYPSIKRYLQGFEPQLSKRYDKGDTPFNLRNCAYVGSFSEKKIVWKEMSSKPPFALDTKGYFTNDTITFITGVDLEYLLGLLNSKLSFYIFSTYYSGGGLGSNGVRFKKEFLSHLPIAVADDKELITDKVNYNLNYNENLYFLKNKFQKYLSSQFQLEKLSKKLQNWHQLEFGEFIKELNKSIKANNKLREKAAASIVTNDVTSSAASTVTSSAVEKPQPVVVPTLTKKDEFEWLDLFEENKQKAQELQTQINQTDKEIDAMVYELYGLTEDEIKIVENT